MIITSPVRKADVNDADEVLAMCREMHRENGMFSMDDGKVRELISRALERRGGVIGVIGKPGKLEASIYLLFTNIWYSTDFHIEELWNFVRPAYRKSDNAKELITFAKRCGDEIGLPVIIGIMSNIRTAAKIRLYERSLGKPAGAFFLHQPPTQVLARAG